jgi:hypothetical protein
MVYIDSVTISGNIGIPMLIKQSRLCSLIPLLTVLGSKMDTLGGINSPLPVVLNPGPYLLGGNGECKLPKVTMNDIDSVTPTNINNTTYDYNRYILVCPSRSPAQKGAYSSFLTLSD